MRVRLGATAALLLLVTGCSSLGGEEGPAPEDAAERLASALTAGTIADLPFEATAGADAQAAYDGIVADLGDREREVSVLDVTTDEAGATTARLQWSWNIEDAAWTYEVIAALVQEREAAAWQVVWSPALVEPSLAEGEVLDIESITPARGDVVGQDGLAIVTERPVSRVGIDKPTLTGRPQAAARALASLVGIDAGDYTRRVKGAGARAFVEAIVYRREELPRAVLSGVEGIDGARIIADDLPLAPTRDFAAPILGRVGEVTAEMIEEDPERYSVGDVAGLSGLQARYDDVLRGVPGRSIAAVAEDGAEREVFRLEPEDGSDLALTLDLDLQAEAESLLAGVRPASALVALRPSTGEILAAANGPGNEGLNLATYGRAAPGSTFKVVTALALLRAGADPSTRVPCTAEIVVNGKRFTNYSDYPAGGLGQIPLRTAMANSCNTAFISRSGDLGPTALFDAGVSLGIGLDHDLGFPAYFGSVEPTTAETEAAAQTIGQGTILASPMVMAAVVGSVQAGDLVVPHLVDGVRSTPPDGAAALTAAEARALRSMLRSVVTDGSGRGLADLPGPPVIAKTGTAEFGAADDLKTHAWMIAAQDDLAVCVYVDIGASGSRTAGPILEAFLRSARGLQG